MSSTTRAAWQDAWEGASTPSPYAYRTSSGRAREERYARQRVQERTSERAYRCAPRETAPGRSAQWPPQRAEATYGVRPSQGRTGQWRADWAEASEWDGSVVRLSAARAARRDYEGTAHLEVERRPQRTSVRDVPSVDQYDWDAAARRRPGRDECERVILHADRCIEARMSSTRYYATGATARRPEPWSEATRREAAPRLRVVSHRVPRWRLRLVAGLFAVLVVGLTVIAPIMASSAVAGLESAVGQAEMEQQQLAADNAALASQISSLSSPQRVAEEAAQLGLAPANDVSYLASGDQLLASEGDTTVAGR